MRTQISDDEAPIELYVEPLPYGFGADVELKADPTILQEIVFAEAGIIRFTLSAEEVNRLKEVL